MYLLTLFEEDKFCFNNYDDMIRTVELTFGNIGGVTDNESVLSMKFIDCTKVVGNYEPCVIMNKPDQLEPENY